jgi:G:T/U-mismatch repair DNA glycosylase
VLGVPEILCDRPAILFVGINPGMRSGETGHNFAGKNNPFWRLLYEARLTPRLLAPEEDARLADFGYTLTNLCPRTTRAANELTASSRRRRRLRAAALGRARRAAPERADELRLTGGRGAPYCLLKLKMIVKIDFSASRGDSPST